MSTPPAELEARIATLRGQSQQAERNFHRAVAAKEHAQREAEKLRAQLQAEFGVSTVDAARALLTQKQQELATEITRVQEHLALAVSE